MRRFAERWIALVAQVALPLAAALVAAAVATAATTVDNPHGRFREDCRLCHDPRAWKDVHIDPKFDHAKYGFALEGAHKAAACASCHTSLEFAQAKTVCASCHTDPHRGEMGIDCARCHGARSFVDRAPMVRAHLMTRFPLTGSHAALDCESCHHYAAQGQRQYAGTPVACSSCHLDLYRATRNPDHVAGGYPTDCQSCHSTFGWAGAKFDHDRTAFPLTGSHRAVACTSCHTGAGFHVTGTTCASCHQGDYDRAQPPHAAAGFAAAACASCHDTRAFSDATFDHSATRFPLTGAHRAVACASCHGDGVYAAKSTACYACHTSTYASASPPHTPASFPTNACATCHTTTAWTTTFNHANTAFPLTGAHAAQACASCHGDGVYVGKSTDCYSCHASTYAGASPPHTPAAFPTSQCATCHGTTTWSGGLFNHTANTSFPLTGAHAPLACASCHGDGVYAGKSTACFSCHASTYASASPPHTAASFPTNACATCHTTTAWTTAFNHSTTAFPLTGAHTTQTCTSCHGDGVYVGKSTDCYSCHAPAYASATNPPHTPANFPTSTASCTGCHNTTAWQPSTFNHSNTRFPLTGAHPAVACTGCHAAATWSVPGTDCASCHMTDYNATTNPKHDPSSFPPTGCACHNTTSWAGATSFDHTAGGFPLLGLHAVPPRVCADCHATYTNTSTACISCHQNSSPGYASGPPAHNETYFPSANCTTCHATAAASFTTWSGGTYANHTWFPITNGNHNIPCMNCHTTSTDLTQYNCSVACHQSAVNQHRAVTNSCGTFSPATAGTMCYCCHRTGNAG